MTTKLKIILITLLLCISAVCSAVFASCSLKSNDSGTEENANGALIRASNNGRGQGGVFIKPEDFEILKDDWYGGDSLYLLSDKANAAICDELTVGEKYYFVYTFKLASNDFNSNGRLNFGISSASGTAVMQSAFEFGNSFCSTQTTLYSAELTYSGKGAPYGVNLVKKGTDDFQTYLAIEVTPLVAGAAFVQFNWVKSVLNVLADQPTEHVACASVKSAEAAADEANSITVTALKYSVVSENEFPNGSIPDDFDRTREVGVSNSSPPLYIGSGYYLVTDIEVNNNGSAQTFGVALFFAETSCLRANLQQSNSSSFSSTNFVNGTLINISYTAPENTETSKKARVIIGLSPLKEGKCPAYIIVYSTDSAVNGTVYYSISLSGYVQTASSDGSEALKYADNGSSYLVTGKSDNSVSEIVIPDSYNGLPVSGINSLAFYHASGVTITKVTIGNSVSTIGRWAFRDNDITEVNFGGNVNYIGEGAFYSNEISSLTLPQRLKEIDAEAFMYNRITQLTLPPFLETIGDRAFYGNYFDSVYIPASVKSIGEDAFDSKVKITVSPDNPYYTVENGVLIEKNN